MLVASGIVLGFLLDNAPQPTPATSPRDAEESSLFSLPPTIEVADTATLRAKGLSGRSFIPADYGMLFVFPQDGREGFWMKDMLAPIDIIWIDAAGVVVHIKADATPESYPEVFRPELVSRYVLETKAGYAKANNIMVGTMFDVSAYKK